MENHFQTRSNSNGEHRVHSSRLANASLVRERELERLLLMDMALQDFAAQFVSGVLHDVTIREQHLASKSKQKREDLVASILPLPTNVAYRDAATRFVSSVLRDVAIRDAATRFMSSVLRDVAIRDAATRFVSSVLRDVAIRDAATRFVSSVLRDVAIREQQGATKVNPVPASEAETCLFKASGDEGVNEHQESSSANSSAVDPAIESSPGVGYHLTARQRLILAELVQAFASEVVASALEKAVVTVGSKSKPPAAVVDSSHKLIQRVAEKKQNVATPTEQQQQQQTRPVSRRQVIYRIAKATTDHVLSIVLQGISSSLLSEKSSHTAVEVPSAAVAKSRMSSPSASEDRISSPPTPADADTDHVPSLHLHVDDPSQPDTSPAVDGDFVRSQVASAFVHTLLLQADSHHAKPQISVQAPARAAADQETSSPGAHSRRKSPNVHKRNLVKKDSAPLSSARTQSSPPPPEKSTCHDDPSQATATEQTPDRTKPKRAGKSDLQPKHHPQKTHEKAVSGDEASTLQAEACSPQMTKSKLTLSLNDNLSFFSATSSPLSSARLAQEIYRPRIPTETSPLVLKKPTARAHPRRHPHHIQNASIAKETSYSRDSSRADAIASELQKKSKLPSADAIIASHLLLPLTTRKASTIPAATTSAQQSPARESPKKQSSRNKNASWPPAKMRSGYCQQCVFEGRSCKISDCLKHQLLK